jgi:pyroglutamyl-peptidase
LRALVTGFDPFGGEALNPSQAAVLALPARIGSLEIATAILPTSFAGADAALAAALDRIRPDLVLGVGLAGGRAALSLERVGLNIDDARIPDNEGALPVDRRIVADGPPALFATLPIKAAVQALRAAGLPAEVSNSAGTFVCNHLLYRALHLGISGGFRAGFLHVPYLPQQAARHGSAPSMAIEHMIQGITIILAISAETRVDLAVAEGALD